jgi:hypothetical protein
MNNELTKKQIKFLKRYTKGKWNYDPTTCLVDVDGDFDFNHDHCYYGVKNAYRKYKWYFLKEERIGKLIEKLRVDNLFGIKFGKVSGNFNCSYNNLTSLGGAPQEVGGNFDCRYNYLTSLEGAPQKVGGNFYCSGNNLTSLEGAPQEVGGDFDCSYSIGLISLISGDFSCRVNTLTSLKGAPQKVGGGFDCSGNNLTSLEGSPQKVGGNFKCYINNLTSLKGAPQEVGGNFDCHTNNLTSLKGAPQEVGGNFDCWYNKLTNLKGAPKKVGGGFDCRGNELESLEGAPKKVRELKCYTLVFHRNEWNVRGWIKRYNKISEKRKPLILPLIYSNIKCLNEEIQKDPVSMMMVLKKCWNDESFKKIKDKLVWTNEGLVKIFNEGDQVVKQLVYHMIDHPNPNVM